MDETAISVRGGPLYLYRAVDKFGKTVDSLLCADRTEAAARAFFCKALETHQPRRPLKLNLDGNAASHRALRLLRQEHAEWRPVVIRSRRYLNNIVERDHRAVKRRCAPMLALKSFRTAAVGDVAMLRNRERTRTHAVACRPNRTFATCAACAVHKKGYGRQSLVSTDNTEGTPFLAVQIPFCGKGARKLCWGLIQKYPSNVPSRVISSLATYLPKESIPRL